METCFKPNEDEQGVFESRDGRSKYRLGIIDFLTDYNTMKLLENKINNVWHWKAYQDASCQEPEIYCKRFLEFMRDKL